MDKVLMKANSGSIPRCRICGGRSTGLHYGVVSCEGCKAFFKRGVSNNIQYKCYFGNNCAVTTVTRGRCKACRFRKCKEEGMDLRAMKGRAWRPEDKVTSSPSPKVDQLDGDDSQMDDISRFPLESTRTSNKHDSFCDSLVQRSHFAGSSVISIPQVPRPRPPALIDITDQTFTNLIALSQPSSGIPAVTSPSSLISSSGSFGSQITSTTPRQSVIVLRQPSVTAANSSTESVISNHENNNDTVISLSAKVNDHSNKTMHNLFSGSLAQDMFPRIGLESFLSKSAVMPNFLREYGLCVKERNNCLKITTDAVSHAMEAALVDLRNKFLEFRYRYVVLGERRYQPETTREYMAVAARKQAWVFADRFRRFAMLLPGFAQLSPEDQKTMLVEKFIFFWMILHSEFYENGELFIIFHEDGFHCGIYWMKFLTEDDYLEVLLKFCEEINSLELNPVERYLLLSVGLFYPDVATNFGNPSSLQLLHAHYLDALMHSIAIRPNNREILTRLEHLLAHLPFVHQLNRNYVMRLDLSTLPLLVRSKGIVRSFREIMHIAEAEFSDTFVVSR